MRFVIFVTSPHCNPSYLHKQTVYHFAFIEENQKDTAYFTE